jgi:para-nitrobenzyl esterase
MLGEKLVSILQLQESRRSRPSLRSAFCSALVLGIAAACSAPSIAAPAPRVVTLDGIFQGKVDATGAMQEFLGIRYAQPVTGNLRWKPPQPVTPSFIPQDATQFGNHCPQPASPFGNASASEDCLFLNVYTPNGKGDHEPFDLIENRPVMVWIHGGALVVGESNEYDASKLVQRGVIVVTINYRLGALGFLAHPALSGESHQHISGNYGIEDQQAALAWVRRNIRAFGGDPERVTMFGESAGGLSTFTNLVSPTAQGLFQRAIVESGAYMLTLPTLAQTETAGTAFANAVGCNQSTQAAALTCLRALPIATILANQALTFPAGSLGPAPNIDGKVLTQSIGTALGSGQFNRVPLINGTNHSEWNLFVAEDFDLTPGVGPVNAATYVPAIAATIGVPAAVATQVAALYPVPQQFPSFDQGVGGVGTDAIFACAAHFADELASSFVPTFAYEFNDPNAPQNFLPPVTFPYGASHASEIQFIFPTASPSGFGLNLPQTPLTANQQKLSDQMVGYWTEFAKSGNPNGHGQPNWPRFDRTQQAMQSFLPPTSSTETNFATVHQCAFWDAASGRTLPPQGNQHAANH